MKYTLKNKEIELSEEEVQEIIKQNTTPVEEKKIGIAISTKRWIPKMDEVYWYIDSGGAICISTWNNNKTDNYRLSQRNVFKTEEEAETHLEYLKAKAIIKDDAEDWIPDWEDGNWEDGNQYKYYGYLDCVYEKLSGDYNTFRKENHIYFETLEKLQNSQKIHEKEWLTYLGIK